MANTYANWMGPQMSGGGANIDFNALGAQVTAQANAARGGSPGIGGTLPWGAGGTPNLSNPAAAYQTAYNQALQMNKAMYDNIMAGYQKSSRQLKRGQKQAMRQVNKVGAAEQQDITDNYNAAVGDAAQTLINRGLGNTTVQQSVNRGIEADRSKAGIRLAGEMARMRGDYRDRFNQQRTALQGQQLQFMNSMTAAYPDFGSYASLIQQQQQPGAALGGGGYSISGLNSGTNPFSPAASAERWNSIQNPAMGSGVTGNYGASIDYSALPSAKKSGPVQSWSGYEVVEQDAPMGIEAWDYYGEQ